ncbi:fatty-acid-binding protein 1 [Beta vulgaris subsp. vulgaris]|uniref:fatty-acid-binding protein 1 n=1 Tax=Beta vulgaris subsp. vulgaris TaxID=3555 RepID=UPI0020371657|nr:fatty-acid-binding protein 1 [Beta vulgaris subsp. vulgaris]
MVSLRFPFFSSFPPPINPNSSASSRRILTAAGVTIAASCAGIAVTHNSEKHPFLQNTLDFILTHFPNSPPSSSSPFWASLSLSSDIQPPPVTESRTGSSFPSLLNASQKLLGIGLRKKSVFGLKNIDVYAFGVYADEDDVKKNLKEKYGKFSASDLEDNKGFSDDLLESDVNLTVRLQIVYSRLSVRSVRSAFEDSVGSRLQKFGGLDNKELLHRFTSLFKDEMKLSKGSVIELSREHGHVLRTKIDGEEIGSIQSKLLCQSVLDLYIGEDPFDEQAKKDVMHKLVTVFEKN